MPTATLQHVQAPPEEPAPVAPPIVSHEAARYAVLRRMGSAIRHQIAGALQPVSMMASLLERRAQAPTPNLESLRKNCSEMTGLSRSASSECVALMGWLAPHEGELVPVGEGIEDCLHLLATELSFRGFAVVHAPHGQTGLVSRLALRAVLPAALMALTDAAQQAAQVRIFAKTVGEQVTVSLTMTPVDEGDAPGRPKVYRSLTWHDVQALSDEEGVELRVTDAGVDLCLQLKVQAVLHAADVRWG